MGVLKIFVNHVQLVGSIFYRFIFFECQHRLIFQEFCWRLRSFTNVFFSLQVNYRLNFQGFFIYQYIPLPFADIYLLFFYSIFYIRTISHISHSFIYIIFNFITVTICPLRDLDQDKSISTVQNTLCTFSKSLIKPLKYRLFSRSYPEIHNFNISVTCYVDMHVMCLDNTMSISICGDSSFT